MSKFQELCLAYALAKQRTEENRQACQKFVEGFICGMSDYFQAPMQIQKESFDKGLMYFETVLTIYEDPNNQPISGEEVIIISWSLEKILDNYILRLFPWMKEFKLFENELDRFEEVYELIFETIKEVYQAEINWAEKGKSMVRYLGLPEDG